MSPTPVSSAALPLTIKKGTVADKVALFSPRTRDNPSKNNYRPTSRTPSALKALTIDRAEHPDLGTRVAFGRRREESFGAPAARTQAITDDQHSLFESGVYSANTDRPPEDPSSTNFTKAFKGSSLRKTKLQYNLSARPEDGDDSKFATAFRKFKVSEQNWQNQSLEGSHQYQSRMLCSPSNYRILHEKKTPGTLLDYRSADLSFKTQNTFHETQQAPKPREQSPEILQDAEWDKNNLGVEKYRKDSRVLYDGKLRRIDERIPVSPSTSASTSSSESAEEPGMRHNSESGCSEGEESKCHSDRITSEHNSAKQCLTTIQHCRPRLGRKPRFLTDDSIVEALERESPQLFQGRPDSPKLDKLAPDQNIRLLDIASSTNSRSTTTAASLIHTKQSEYIDSSQPVQKSLESTPRPRPDTKAPFKKQRMSRSSTSSEDIADQLYHGGLSARASRASRNRPLEIQSFRETLDSLDAMQASRRKPSHTIRSSLSMQRIRGSFGKSKPKTLGSSRKGSVANFFASINTPIRQWSFSDKWKHTKDDGKQDMQMVSQQDGPIVAESRKQSVSDVAIPSKGSITDVSGRSQKQTQGKTCYISFEEPRRLSERIENAPAVHQVQPLRRSSKSTVAELVKPTSSTGQVRGLSIVVTLDGGVEVAVNAKVSGKEWNIDSKNQSSHQVET